MVKKDPSFKLFLSGYLKARVNNEELGQFLSDKVLSNTFIGHFEEI